MAKKTLITCFTLLCLSQITACGPMQSNLGEDGPPLLHIDPTNVPDAIPKHEPQIGKNVRYKVNGTNYRVLGSSKNYDKVGLASWYGKKFHGKVTSYNEPFNMYGMTAASTELPLPSYVRVTNLANGRQVVVRVNDRGPFRKNRIIDLSYMAAKKLGFIGQGTTMVRVVSIDPPAKKTHSAKSTKKISAKTTASNKHKHK